MEVSTTARVKFCSSHRYLACTVVSLRKHANAWRNTLGLHSDVYAIYKHRLRSRESRGRGGRCLFRHVKFPAAYFRSASGPPSRSHSNGRPSQNLARQLIVSTFTITTLKPYVKPTTTSVVGLNEQIPPPIEQNIVSTLSGCHVSRTSYDFSPFFDSALITPSRFSITYPFIASGSSSKPTDSTPKYRPNSPVRREKC